MKDPQFRYVRWCTDTVIEDLPARRLIGAVSKGGKEGHITGKGSTGEGRTRDAAGVFVELAHAIAGYIYGEAGVADIFRHTSRMPERPSPTTPDAQLGPINPRREESG
ncbi:MAG: hypothetical protein U0361_01970 [Nitrospiraceae bacterium]